MPGYGYAPVDFAHEEVPMSRSVLLLICCLWSGSLLRAEESEARPQASPADAIDWHTDYADGMRAAKAQQKLMFVWFHGAPKSQFGERFEAVSLRDRKVTELLNRYVAVKLPQDAKIVVNG